MGPSASDGKNVSPATMSTTPKSSAANSGVFVGNVPVDAGTLSFLASDPAMASVGMMRKNRPTSMASPSAVFIHCVFAVMPAKAEPLLLAAEVNAYRTSVNPWGPGFQIDVPNTVGVTIAIPAPTSTAAGMTSV